MEPMENALPQNKMATTPVGKLILTMSLPLMLSMIMEALYNVVDSLFIARVSENALAALSLAFPIQLLVVSISVGTGAGVNAALSRLLGEKDQKGVNDVASNSIFIALLTSLVFLIFGLFFTRPYFASQTADPEIIQLGVDYLCQRPVQPDRHAAARCDSALACIVYLRKAIPVECGLVGVCYRRGGRGSCRRISPETHLFPKGRTY